MRRHWITLPGSPEFPPAETQGEAHAAVARAGYVETSFDRDLASGDFSWLYHPDTAVTFENPAGRKVIIAQRRTLKNNI